MEQTLTPYDLQYLLYTNFVPLEKYKAVHTLLFEEAPTEETLKEYQERLDDYTEQQSSYDGHSY
jgi:hypothetical protein